MSTRTDLQNRIEQDLHRTDLSAHVSTAIDSAIRHYERKPFWFLEGRATLTTSASQTWYGVPSDLKGFDNMLVTISGSKDPLTRRHYVDIDEQDEGIATGTPAEWTYYQDQIRIYPIPNGQYALTLSYKKSLPTATGSASTSWTNEGFDLLRYRSEWDIYSSYLRLPEMAASAKQSEMEAFQSIAEESGNKVSTGKIRKTSW